MKKLLPFIFVSVVFSFLFGGCNPSDDNEGGNKKVISKIGIKILENNGNDDSYVTDTHKFIYNKKEVVRIENRFGCQVILNYEGSKIISTTGCDDGKLVFLYTDNYLTKVIGDQLQNEYFYESEKLKEVKRSYKDDNFTKKYSTKYIYTGNNVTETNVETEWSSTPTKTEYKFDNKNNPFKNHNLFLKGLNGRDIFSENNAIEVISGDVVIQYTIIYDSDDFPIKVTGINQKTGKFLVEYTYEYIKI